MNSTKKKDCDSLPTGWRKTSLGELTYQFSKKITPSLNSEYKFIGMDCIEKDTLKPSFLHEFKDFKSSGNFFQEGNILYGRLRPYLNKVYQAEFNGVASGEFIVMNSTENIVNKFLMYILHSNQFVHWSNALASGDKPRVKYNQISNYPIKLPPLNEQTRIVTKIEKLFSNLDNSDKYLLHLEKQLKRYRQSVLKSAFEGELTREWREKQTSLESADELLEKIKLERIEYIESEIREKFQDKTEKWIKSKVEKEVEKYELLISKVFERINNDWIQLSLEAITHILGDGLHGTPKYTENTEYFFINGNNLVNGKVEIKNDTKTVSEEEYIKYFSSRQK